MLTKFKFELELSQSKAIVIMAHCLYHNNSLFNVLILIESEITTADPRFIFWSARRNQIDIVTWDFVQLWTGELMILQFGFSIFIDWSIWLETWKRKTESASFEQCWKSFTSSWRKSCKKWKLWNSFYHIEFFFINSTLYL